MIEHNLNKLAARVHAANIKWWQNIETQQPIARNPYELLALVLSEVAECLEGERKNLMDDKLPHRRMAEVEMADTYIRLLDFAAGFDFKVQKLKLPKIKLIDELPDNKGEALFTLMRYIVHIGDCKTNIWICLSLSHIECYCLKFGYDLMGAVEEKLAFNSTRTDHTHEARKLAGGKQF